MCFSIVTRTGGPSQPKRLRKAASAAAARFGPSTPGHTTSSAPPAARLHRHLVRERDRLEDRADLVQPVGPPRAHVEAEVELRGRARLELEVQAGRLSSRSSCAKSCGAERLGACVGRMPHVLQRLARGLPDAGRPARLLQASAAAPCGGVRTRPAPARPARRWARARSAACARARSRRSAPAGTRCARSGARTPPRTRAGPARTGSRTPSCPGCAASRSAISRCTITHQKRRLGQLLDRPQDRRRGDAVGQVRDHLAGQRIEPAEARASSRRRSPASALRRGRRAPRAARARASGRSRSRAGAARAAPG